MPQPFEISVVGAGISGLACAILLRRSGHNVTVFERFSESKPIGSGLLLQPTGLTALERLGLRFEIESLGHHIDRLHGITDKGRSIFNLSYSELPGAGSGLAVHRSALHRTLWNGFAQSDTELVTDCSITGARMDICDRPQLITDSKTLLPPVDLIIDASGSSSSLRPLIGDDVARPFDYGAVWTTVNDIEIVPNTLSQRYVGASVMLGYLPIGKTSRNGPSLAALFWSLKPGNYQDWRDNFTRWQRQAQALWPELSPVIDSLDGPDMFTLAQYQHFTARRPWNGHLVLVGDAAHSTSPQLGQGANQGLIDAVVLCDALDNCRTIRDALKLYFVRRRHHVRFYQMASDLMTPLFQSDSRLRAHIRDIAFKPMQSIPFIRREMVRTLAGLKTGWLSAQTAADIVNH